MRQVEIRDEKVWLGDAWTAFRFKGATYQLRALDDGFSYWVTSDGREWTEVAMHGRRQLVPWPIGRTPLKGY